MNLFTPEETKEFIDLQCEYLNASRIDEWTRHPLYQRFLEQDRRGWGWARPDLIGSMKKQGVY